MNAVAWAVLQSNQLFFSFYQSIQLSTRSENLPFTLATSVYRVWRLATSRLLQISLTLALRVLIRIWIHLFVTITSRLGRKSVGTSHRLKVPHKAQLISPLQRQKAAQTVSRKLVLSVASSRARIAHTVLTHAATVAHTPAMWLNAQMERLLVSTRMLAWASRVASPPVHPQLLLNPRHCRL